MAKSKKRGGKSADPSDRAASKDSEPAPAPPMSKDLQDAIGVFAKGDYARARNMLFDKEKDAGLSEGAKEQARELIAATRIERGTLYVGLACIALFILVVIVTSAMQP